MIRIAWGLPHFGANVYLTSWEMLLLSREPCHPAGEQSGEQQLWWPRRKQHLANAGVASREPATPGSWTQVVELKASRAQHRSKVIFVTANVLEIESRRNSRAMHKFHVCRQGHTPETGGTALVWGTTYLPGALKHLLPGTLKFILEVSWVIPIETVESSSFLKEVTLSLFSQDWQSKHLICVSFLSLGQWVRKCLPCETTHL